MRATTVGALVAMATAATASYVEYFQCDDKVTCDPFTCKTGDIPSNSCQGNGAGSMVIGCTKSAGQCASLIQYSGDKCNTMPAQQTDIVCGTCYPPKGNSSMHTSLRCGYGSGGKQEIEVVECGDSACTQCNPPKWTIPQGTCTPLGDSGDDKLHSQMFKELYVCEVVMQATFASHDCSGDAVGLVAMGSGGCNAGTRLTCH